jgi:hypothetical protein
MVSQVNGPVTHEAIALQIGAIAGQLSQMQAQMNGLAVCPAAIADLTTEFKSHKLEMKPVADAYQAGRIGAKAMAWLVAMLVGLSTLYLAFRAPHQPIV